MIGYGYTYFNTRQMGFAGLGDAATTSKLVSTSASAVAASIATYGAEAGVGAALVTLGVAAEAIPVIGTIAGALAITAGLVATAQAKAKAIKAQKAQVDQENSQLSAQSVELDNQIIDVNNKKTSINQQLQQSGLAGLGSFKTFFQKVVTPAKYAQSQLNDSVAENQLLTASINDKISFLQNATDELQTLFDTLTKGLFKQKTNKILLWTGAAVGVTALIGTFIYLGNEYKWFK